MLVSRSLSGVAALVLAALSGVQLSGRSAPPVALPFSDSATISIETTAPVTQVAEVETPDAPESHLGFDTSKYPGDAAMRAWHDASSPYEWVGYYLPAPCHKDESWSGKRETLTDMGWGLAVLYVGQQAWTKLPGLSPKALRAARNATGRCATTNLSAARGTADADDAIARTQQEGFAPGTVIFLDVEYMTSVPDAMRTYYTAWVSRVLADGRFTPGIYVSTHNAELVHEDVAEAFAAAGKTTEAPFWIAGSKGFSPGKLPADVGHAFAAMWQGVLDVVRQQNGVRLPIDESVAAVRNPSAVALGD
jgi:hypothetical protein